MKINPHRLPPEQMLWGLGDLALFLGGSEDSFTGDLLHLIAKADSVNRTSLFVGFPAEVDAYEVWMASPEPSVSNLTQALTNRFT